MRIVHTRNGVFPDPPYTNSGIHRIRCIHAMVGGGIQKHRFSTLRARRGVDQGDTQGAGREGDRSHNILYTVVRTGRVPASNILYDADKRGPSARAAESIRG